MTVIQEVKDLTKLFLEELIGSLMIYELNMAQREEEKESKKMKTIIFKSTTHDEENDESEEEEDKEESDNDEDMALLIEKFKKFLMERSMKKKKNDEEKVRSVTCYNCNKRGHYKLNCLLLKKHPKKIKKRAMIRI